MSLKDPEDVNLELSGRIMLFLLLFTLATAFVMHAQAASTVQVVTPDLAGMIYPRTSTSQVVQFGDPSSSAPNAYEFIAPASGSFPCINAQLCLELEISSAFDSDPFFLHGYAASSPLASTTFEGFDASDVLPLIPGGSDANSTVWWFQSNGTPASSWTGSGASEPPTIDLLLRLRQRSQRLSARDQLLVRLRVDLVDPRTTSSAIESFVVYGSQRVTQTTTRVDSKTIRVLLSITRNPQKSDANPHDAYPLLAAASFASTSDSSTAATSCNACFDFLDACRAIPFCKAVVLPCLLSYLESMTSKDASTGSGSDYDADGSSSQSLDGESAGSSRGSDAMETGNVGDSDEKYDMEAWYSDFFTDNGSFSRFLAELEVENEEESATASLSSSQATGSGSTGSGQGEVDGTKRIDFLGPLATCTADLLRSDWDSIRQTFLCLSRLNCALGVVEGEDAGEVSAITLSLSTGRQQFAVRPTTVGTNNVDMTIKRHEMVSSGLTSPESTYRASASYLEMFLRSTVQAGVSVSLEASAANLNMIQVSLEYVDALAFYSLGFSSEGNQLTMLENSPAQVTIEYPASSPQPVLDILVRELRARTQPDQDTTHSWRLAPECLACSAQVFGCSTQAVADHSCSYEATRTAFGQCIEQQLPTSLYETMMQGSGSGRPVTAELSRCVVNTATSSTDKLYAIMQASSGLACFASTRCPFGPIRLVQDAMAIVLEATSYIHVVRVLLSSSAGIKNIKIEYKVDNTLIGTTAPLYSTASELEIQQAIEVVLASAGIGVSVRSWIGTTATTEWTLEIVYRNVFLPSFAANAVVDEALVKSGAMKQIVMEGGEAELRALPRDSSKVFQQIGSTPTTSGDTSAPSPSPDTSIPSDRSTSSEEFECLECINQLQECRQDAECESALTQFVLPFVQMMYNNMDDAPYVYDATGTMLYSVFPSIQALSGRQKMLALLTCSNSYCVQRSCNTGKPGAIAAFVIEPATSKFWVDTGDEMTVHGLHGDSYSVLQSNDTTELSSLLENSVFDGYATSGVRVTATYSPYAYSGLLAYYVKYEGWMGSILPHFEFPAADQELYRESFEASAHFRFTTTTPDMLDAFRPWISWLGQS